MRYRIILGESIHLYELVIYRNFDEEAGGKNLPIAAKQASAIARVFTTVTEELRGHSAFYVKRIEEVPAD